MCLPSCTVPILLKSYEANGILSQTRVAIFASSLCVEPAQEGCLQEKLLLLLFLVFHKTKNTGVQATY